MTYCFDEIVDRKNTYSLKHDFATKRGFLPDVLPMWVADMDFRAPSFIVEALIKRAEHGVFGYSETDEKYAEIVIDWYKNRQKYTFQSSWLVKTPGVVYALAMSVKAFTSRGDAVLVQKPVYYPFSEVIIDNNRQLINNSLKNKNGRYVVDYVDFEEKIVQNNVKLFILCSPHNPIGRVWEREELLKMGEICKKHGVVVVSDEIHSDIVFANNRHNIFTSVDKSFEDFTIICTSPSKTFNLAGLIHANIFIANYDLRKKFLSQIASTGLSQLGIMGIISCEAAYKFGNEWVDQLNAYLEKNINLTKNFLKDYIPEITLTEPEGTYLLWLNFEKTGKTDKEFGDFLKNDVKIWTDMGTMFGAEGTGFFRINAACPRQILEEGLERLKKAMRR